MTIDTFFHPDLNDPYVVKSFQPPVPIYHYTTAEGLAGILESGIRLRSSHHRYLNDSAEITFGLDLARQVLEKFRALIGDDVTNEVQADLDVVEKEDVFVACFSASPDVLSQWRAYAANGRGYCLCLKPERRFSNFLNEDGVSWTHSLFEVSYGVDAVRGLKQRFERMLQRWSSSDKRQLRHELYGIAYEHSLLSKHGHFSVEEEWRIVTIPPPDEVKYRVGQQGLVPYAFTEPLELFEVWVGPNVGPDPASAVRTTQGILREHNLKATVHHWGSTFRG